MNSQLVHASPSGQLTTTSEVVAKGVGIQHKNVLETNRKNQADFELGPSEPFHVVYERATGELPLDRGNKYTGKHHKHLMEQEKATLTTSSLTS